MAAGYAGFFTIWSNMKAHMAASDMRISALCMLASIVVFVMWEVRKMIVLSSALHGLQGVLEAPPSEFNSRLAAQEQEERRIRVRLMKWWPLVLLFTIAPALVATSLLIYSFIINL
jgi:hypothetical protein